MPFWAKESPFLAFQIKQRNQNKETKWHLWFFKVFARFLFNFSKRCKICKIRRRLALRQTFLVLMTALFDRFHVFIVWSVKSWTGGNHLFSNNSKKTIPWNVMTENTMEKLLKVNPLWGNAKLQILVGLNAANDLIAKLCLVFWELVKFFNYFFIYCLCSFHIVSLKTIKLCFTSFWNDQ